MNRRDFLGRASAAALASTTLARHAFAADISATPKSPNDRIQLGIIGPGSRGKELMLQFLHVPGAEFVAAADVYQPRFAEADRVAGRKLAATEDYRELIARPDVDAIVIASPLFFHKDHVLAALGSGKPVYSEKAMGFTMEDCRAIYTAARRGNRLLQVGHQYRYATWITEAIGRVAKGQIGEVTHIYAYWHRNTDWRRRVPVPDPGGRLEHLLNWRLYRESSGGLVTELGAHHIDFANWIFGGQPESVLGTTSNVTNHDGRTEGDNVQAIFKYAGGKRLVFSSLEDNAKQGNEVWVYGTEGSLQITVEDAVFYYEKKKAVPAQANATVIEHGVETGASYAPGGEMPYRGPGDKVQVVYEEPTLTACRSFIECVRGKGKPFADVEVGYRAAVACAVAHDAVFTEEKTAIPGLPVG